jgi:hypothetical protein
LVCHPLTLSEDIIQSHRESENKITEEILNEEIGKIYPEK